jgi:outer membrane protein OmpA-like peptidoglycan-associated protein
MKKKLLLMLIIIFCFGASLSAETFRYLFTKGEKYRFVSTVIEKAYINGELINTSEILDKITFEVIDVKNNSGNISAIYQVSERLVNEVSSYLLQEEYPSNFAIDPQGRITVASSFLFPLTRNIPLFPESDLKPGYSWQAVGTEAHDFRRLFGIEEPYRFDVNVQYTYLGKRVIDKKTVAEIKVVYQFFHKVINITPAERMNYPVKISGAIEMQYFWDLEAGKPYSYEEEFDVMYYLATGDYYEFVGIAKGQLILSPELNETKTTNDIQKDLEKERIEGVRVEKADRGVKIVLENIQFEADSDVIDVKERGKLDRISQILKKYPERDILVIGYTAGMGTPEYLQGLSMRRAKSVGDYLLSLGTRKPEQMTIIGKGATEPVANNTTEEGRKKNRRVEIIILEI